MRSANVFSCLQMSKRKKFPADRLERFVRKSLRCFVEFWKWIFLFSWEILERTYVEVNRENVFSNLYFVEKRIDSSGLSSRSAQSNLLLLNWFKLIDKRQLNVNTAEKSGNIRTSSKYFHRTREYFQLDIRLDFDREFLPLFFLFFKEKVFVDWNRLDFSSWNFVQRPSRPGMK